MSGSKPTTKKKDYERPTIVHVEKLDDGAARPKPEDPTCDSGPVR